MIKRFIFIGTLLTLFVIHWFFKEFQATQQKELQQIQRQLSNTKKSNKLHDYLSAVPQTAPSITASELQTVLNDLAEEYLLTDLTMRLVPKDPVMQDNTVLQYATIAINATTYLDKNIFEFITALQQYLEQPIHLESLNIRKKRDPDIGDYNLLENGQITDLLNADIVLRVFFVMDRI